MNRIQQHIEEGDNSLYYKIIHGVIDKDTLQLSIKDVASITAEEYVKTDEYKKSDEKSWYMSCQVNAVLDFWKKYLNR